MKALQQAARNRDTGPAGPPEPDGRTSSEPQQRPADTVGDLGIVPAAAHAAYRGEASLPVPGSPETGTTAAELSLEPIGGPAAQTDQTSLAVDEVPRTPEHVVGNPRTHRPPGADAAVAATSARQDQRSAPRWSGDLQQVEATPDAEGADRNRRRGAGRIEASPARAESVLAAGAGAAQTGMLSRITPLQWIIASGLVAGALLFAYFYIQISYPGLLQRGFQQPVLSAPAGNRSPQSTAAAPDAATAGAVAVGSVPAAGTLPPQQGTLPGPAALPVPVTPADMPATLAASPLLNPPAGATPASGATSPSPAPAAPAAPAAATVRAAPSPTARTSGPTVPPSPPAATVAAAASPAASPAPAPETATARAATPTQAGNAIQVTRGSSASPVNPVLADAFDHLQAGRIESAQRLYSQVASSEPRNVDALLGLAAVAQLGNQPEAANRLWLRVLELEPRNAHAQAGLIGQLGRADPIAAESQLRTLIGREPSPFLYFTLGNLYADQNRWTQAQQAWFQAYHLQPGNADYAFNLAIGLERISQPRLAITYLRTAIRLAEAGPSPNFDVAAARKRAALLEATHGVP